MTAAPFLDLVAAEELVVRIPPLETTELLVPSSGFFSSAYVESIRQERRRIDALRSVVPSDPALADQLTQDLLYAESGANVGNEDAGRVWIDAAQAATERVFARAAPAPNQAFTLASGTTAIPVRMPGSEGPALAVQIELQSSQLRFPDGRVQQTTITDEEHFVTFRVETTGAGQIAVNIVVRAPNGRVLSESPLDVRSTAFNRVAVGITVLAALALVALWLRRLMARRRAT